MEPLKGRDESMNQVVSPRRQGKRTFLFLQGCTSPFFARLGDQLRAAGHAVYRINFNVGDAVYWWGRPAWQFRGSVEQLPAYLQHKFEQYGFTDLVVLGDTRPLHAPALALAERFGARAHVLEEGYFRPNWLTLERGGINGYSRLPKDPDWFRQAAKLVPNYGDSEAVPNPVRLLALHELGYHLPNLLNPLLYKGYRTHRPHISGIEFYGWATRFARMPLYERKDAVNIERLLRHQTPYYLFPLQLNSDSQIRHHSGSRGVPFLVKRVINSFFRHAPADAHLVIKNHPLDTGLIDYRHWIGRLERRLKLHGRILYLESGHLPTLLDNTRGVVTINSSVGTSAFVHGCPTIAIGDAIYDMEGLTFQGSLDQFWTNLVPPDRALYRDFRNTVIHCTQINGGFYTRQGIALGVQHCVERMSEDHSRLDQLLWQTHGMANVCATPIIPASPATAELALQAVDPPADLVPAN